jgi:hypothetical protein
MSVSIIRRLAQHLSQSVRGVRAFAVLPAVVLLSCASLSIAQEEGPSKPFLEKNSFYLSSAGFRVRFANGPAGLKAMRALPAHRFVIQRNGGNVRYLFAEPHLCVCIFVGTQANYQDYRDILSQGLQQPDFVSPDYRTQVNALLYGDPYAWESLYQPEDVLDYLQDW